MGVVFEAEEVTLKRPVALKVMRDSMAEREGARDRFLREARAMASVKHDNIATVYQAGCVGDVPYLAMEYLRGATLDSWLKRGQKPTTFQVVRMGWEMARGLAAAHDRGVMHRDVKPANIWLEAPTGRVKLLDFGLAKPYLISASSSTLSMKQVRDHVAARPGQAVEGGPLQLGIRQPLPGERCITVSARQGGVRRR